MIAQRSFYSIGQEIWQIAALGAPELWTPPSDKREGGHVWVKEEHVATLNDQTQAGAPAVGQVYEAKSSVNCKGP